MPPRPTDSRDRRASPGAARGGTARARAARGATPRGRRFGSPPTPGRHAGARRASGRARRPGAATIPVLREGSSWPVGRSVHARAVSWSSSAPCPGNPGKPYGGGGRGGKEDHDDNAGNPSALGRLGSKGRGPAGAVDESRGARQVGAREVVDLLRKLRVGDEDGELEARARTCAGSPTPSRSSSSGGCRRGRVEHAPDDVGERECR